MTFQFQVLSGYLDFMTSFVVLLGGERNRSRNRMLEILDLEQKLATITPSLEELRDPSKNYHKTTLGALKVFYDVSFRTEFVLKAQS